MGATFVICVQEVFLVVAEPIDSVCDISQHLISKL